MRTLLQVLLLVSLLTPSSLLAQKPLADSDAEGHPWWRHAVFYEIYPRSFGDSDSNGMGDLNGITAHLDYLKSLGVDAIWITPCFPSPQVDFGYDVSDYEAIAPEYGTLRDFDRLQTEARKRGIRVILDFVVNHTSDKHKWFLESRASKSNPKRDWYVWRDGKDDQPPNNWTSLFGGPAWKLDPTTSQFYYHYFYAEQPDLNWRNPQVKAAMFDQARFWLKRGVAGFRLDAVDTLFEDPELRDNPPEEGTDAYGMPNQKRIYNTKLPENHTVLRDLRKVADQYHAVLIGETWTNDVNELKQYYGEHDDEVQLPMDFLFCTINKLSAPAFRHEIGAIESSGEWPVFVFSNHDIKRAYDRYGDGQHNDDIAKLLAAMYLTLRGTPIMYYGEEIGMENRDPVSKEDVRDPIGIRGWPREKGRDGERTPMQWSDAQNAGFTRGKPWLPIAANYKTHNVAAEDKNKNSVLNFYRAVLKLHHADPALVEGNYMALNENDQNVLAYLRQYKDRAVLVALNLSGEAQKASFDLTGQGFTADAKGKALLTSNADAAQSNLREITLQPFGVFIAEVMK